MIPSEMSGFHPSGLSRVLGSQAQRKAVPQSKVPSFCSSQTKCFSLKNLAFISLFYVKKSMLTEMNCQRTQKLSYSVSQNILG